MDPTQRRNRPIHTKNHRPPTRNRPPPYRRTRQQTSRMDTPQTGRHYRQRRDSLRHRGRRLPNRQRHPRRRNSTLRRRLPALTRLSQTLLAASRPAATSPHRLPRRHDRRIRVTRRQQRLAHPNTPNGTNQAHPHGHDATHPHVRPLRQPDHHIHPRQPRRSRTLRQRSHHLRRLLRRRLLPRHRRSLPTHQPIPQPPLLLP